MTTGTAGGVGRAAVTRDEVAAAVQSRFTVVCPDGRASDDLSTGAELYPGDRSDSTWRVLLRSRSGRARVSPVRAFDHMLRLGYLARLPDADVGHVAYTPSGTVLSRLIVDWMEAWASHRFGGSEIVTPAVFRWGDPNSPVTDLAWTFSDRLYHVDRTGGTRGADADGALGAVLRYSADPGFFSYLAGSRLSAGQLPLRLWELLDCYRCDRPNELRGLTRARSFRLLDHHTICATPAEALREYVRVFGLQCELMRDSPVRDAVVEFTVEEGVYPVVLASIVEMAGALGAPVLVERLSGRKHYWSFKHRFVDELLVEHVSCQFDPDNASRFNIRTRDMRTRDGSVDPAGLVVLHTALSSVEKWLTAAVTGALLRTPHVLPTWLAPTQVRILPVGGAQEYAHDVARRLGAARIRADVDDRGWSLAWRIRQGELEWVPLMAVVGPQEQVDGTLTLRSRAEEPLTGTVPLDALVSHVHAACAGKPYRGLGSSTVQMEGAARVVQRT